MINTHAAVVAALQAAELPVYYELALNSNCTIPCVSYLETNNASYKDGDSLRYSNVSYMVKVWANDLQTILEKREAIDEIMRDLGFTRTHTETLGQGDSITIQGVMEYDAITIEED